MNDTSLLFDAVEQAIQAIANGELVVVVDDEREHEGDVIMAASKATTESAAFMIRYTSGILCTPLAEAEAARLELGLMVPGNDSLASTAFTVSVDYRAGLTTGISAQERAATARALADPGVGASDFVRPGHMFPLIARQGGVLVRPGHTEAAVDLVVLAGLPPVSLLAELVNDDGSMQRVPQLLAFARRHQLKIIRIADLIAYRRQQQ